MLMRTSTCSRADRRVLKSQWVMLSLYDFFPTLSAWKIVRKLSYGEYSSPRANQLISFPSLGGWHEVCAVARGDPNRRYGRTGACYGWTVFRSSRADGGHDAEPAAASAETRGQRHGHACPASGRRDDSCP